MSDDGLCRYCGAYIGTDHWDSCPNCGEEFDDEGGAGGGSDEDEDEDDDYDE